MKKILLISMNSVHVKRWVDNLKDTDFELFWFDILDRGKLETSLEINQIIDWKKRKIKYIRGEYLLRKKYPKFYYKVQPFLEITIEQQLEKIINEIKPDILHSFEMQNCTYPILNVMLKYPKLKWLYSCWGSDLFYFQNFKKEKVKLKKTLKRINFLHTDCFRDYKIAKNLGFVGEFLGVIPGGGGFKLIEFEKFQKPIIERKIILVKGYEHEFGKALNVLKALKLLLPELKSYKIVVFGAHQEIINFILMNNLVFDVYSRNELSHFDIISLMGKSKIYIGNSISDGMPNTLLEAIIMGVYPIQSNPGGVTSEIIDNGINGLLINNPNDVSEIKYLIKRALKLDKKGDFEKARKINKKISNQRLEYEFNQQKIVNLYNKIATS
ncbi:glycosyltransferase [Polaribacter sp. Z022]|uniref:glycosyltransferase n=1 Tax=Polaribacter sp. Z022 TaxID=2927125 RepID=UPI00202258CD|nr:glycosyltransferase [Polaribacter sp. Z022]